MYANPGYTNNVPSSGNGAVTVPSGGTPAGVVQSYLSPLEKPYAVAGISEAAWVWVVLAVLAVVLLIALVG